jgi:hypothetical protein
VRRLFTVSPSQSQLPKAPARFGGGRNDNSGDGRDGRRHHGPVGPLTLSRRPRLDWTTPKPTISLPRDLNGIILR